MTREIRVNERAVKAVKVNASTISGRASAVTAREKSSGFVRLLGKVNRFCNDMACIKRELSEGFVAVTEALADKTAREGLFGEDKGKGYAGTDMDYIER